MDGQTQSISSQQLYQHLGTASAPILVDVRRQDAFGTDDRLIIGALYRPPEEVERWRKEFSANRPIVAYCNHGREVSQGVAATLRKPAWRPNISRAASGAGRNCDCRRAASVTRPRISG